MQYLFQCTPGKFIVVQYSSGEENQRQSRLYVGSIIDKPFANRLRVRFLREYLDRKNTFHYLDADRRPDDIDIINITAVVKILPHPEEKRGVLLFVID